MVTQANLRNCSDVSWAEVKKYCDAHGIGILDEHYGLEGWKVCEVRTASLRNMHGKFGRQEDFFIELPKGQLLQEQSEVRELELTRGNFPRSKLIQTKWPNKPLIVVQRTLSSGELYVADGVTRTFNAIHNREPWLHAYMITLDQEREVV